MDTGEDPPPQIGFTTVGGILRQTSSSFCSLIFTFFLLSFLLFAFRTSVENGTVSVTAFIDRDPSLRSLLSRLDITGKNSPQSSPLSSDGHHLPTARHPRRRAFLHLTRVGTLDDDFFSGDDDDGRSFVRNFRKAEVNGSLLALSGFDSRLGFSNFIDDNGIRYPEVVKNGVSFKLEGFALEGETNDAVRNETAAVSDEERETEEGGEDNGLVDLRFFIAGLELGRRDAAALFFLVSVLSAAYGWLILGFVITYSWILGIVFVSVVNDLLGRYSSSVENIWCGWKLGLKRLSGFVLMRWAVRDALTQILGLWFFGDIEDQYSFFKLFLRLKLMPFSVASPWIRGYEEEISGFLFAWFLMDTLVSFVFSVDSWVTIVSARRSGREIVKEGCNLLNLMFNPAVQLKCLEVVLCGSFLRWALAHLCGRTFAMLVQSLVEVYFMVAWLMFYLAARSRGSVVSGRRFGRRELEGLVEVFR